MAVIEQVEDCWQQLSEVIDTDDLGVSARLMAWASTQADAWTLAADVRENVVQKLAASVVPVGGRWSRIMSEPQKP